MNYLRWTQLPRGLRLGSVATRLLGLRVRIPSGHGCLSLVRAVCCQSFQHWTYHSSRGVLQSVVCLWSWSVDNDQSLAHCCAVKVLYQYDLSSVLSYNFWFFETLALRAIPTNIPRASITFCVGGLVGLLGSLDALEERRFSSPSLKSNHYFSVFNPMT